MAFAGRECLQMTNLGHSVAAIELVARMQNVSLQALHSAEVLAERKCIDGASS